MTGPGARVWEMRMVAPTRWLNANDSGASRGARMARADDIAMWRDAAKRTAAANRLPRGLGRVRIDVYLSFTDDRRRDVANWMPSVKPTIDGIVDHGLVPDDSGKYLDGPFLHMGDRIPRRVYGPVGELRIVITELTTNTEEDPHARERSPRRTRKAAGTGRAGIGRAAPGRA